MSDHPAIILSPYARTMGICLDHWDGDMPVLAMDFSPDVCGNPGMFHGGVLGGLIELAALARMEAYVAASNGQGRGRPLGITLSYLRTAGACRLHAGATILRAGRRLANMQVQAWQEDKARPVATAFINIALDPSAA